MSKHNKNFVLYQVDISIPVVKVEDNYLQQSELYIQSRLSSSDLLGTSYLHVTARSKDTWYQNIIFRAPILLQLNLSN